MKDGVDHLPVGHLTNLDEADEDGELEIVGGCHSDDFVRPLDLTVRRTHDVRHFGAQFVVQIILLGFTEIYIFFNAFSMRCKFGLFSVSI